VSSRHSRLPPLASLQAFESAARLASFKAAAAELSVTPTAISHHVSHLEAHLGVQLMERTPRSMRLTPAGAELFAAATAGFQEIKQTVRGLRNVQRRASLTISTTPAFLGLWLLPRLAQLRSLLPDLDLQLHASEQRGTLAAGGVDVAIRYTDKPMSSADATLLHHDELTPASSPRLQLRHKSDLRHATLLHVDGWRTPRRPPSWAKWCAQAGVQDVDVDAGLRFNDSLYAVEAAIAGHGVVLASPVLIADALASGRLLRPFPESLPGAAYYLLCRPALCADPQIGALQDWLLRSLVPAALTARASRAASRASRPPPTAPRAARPRLRRTARVPE
jgi:LysR family glycine cleavage system transcriptional activator